MNDHDDKGKSTGAGAAVGAAVGGVAAGATTGALAGGLTGPVGAALGAVVGAVVGAVSGRGAKAADDTHGSTGGSSVGGSGLQADAPQGGAVHTVIGAFEDRSRADQAVQRLVQGGFARQDVHVEHQSTPEAGGPQGASAGRAGFFPGLFEMDDDTGRARNAHYAQHAGTYEEAVRRGSAVIVVDTHSEAEADRATALLHEAGAIDVDEHAKQWREQGWTPPAAAAVREGSDGGQVLDVVQEELQVGKRTLDRGGVRVVQRVSSRPVHELVRLREEHAVVDRHPVDRPATSQELSNFKEGTLEVHESVEEPVVAKSARVVEEVRVGKEVREREETIEETLRRKDVEVQRLGADRERAVASDQPLRSVADKDKPAR